MSFFGNLFGGSNPTLNNDINQSGAISGFSTGVGEADTTAASKFDLGILSGDPSLEAEALAPEISSAQKRAQQQKKTSSEFGTRSGGTAASTAAADAGVSTDILNEEGGLKTGAASGAASIGANEQQLGLSAEEAQAQQSQQRMENQRSSLFGQGIGSAFGAAEEDGLSALGI